MANIRITTSQVAETFNQNHKTSNNSMVCNASSEGRKRNNRKNQRHNAYFFVDYLKLYASNINITKKQLDLVTAFFKDTGITFGEDKCAY